jgi:uncharacterized protein (DUF302 family)
MDFHYTVTAQKDFDSAVAAVEAAVTANGFRVLHVHDIQATFQDRGVEHDPYKIVEVCNVGFAKQALESGLLVGLMMPCKINVYLERGQTKISLFLPSTVASFFPQAGLEGLAGEVEAILKRAVDAAAA